MIKIGLVGACSNSKIYADLLKRNNKTNLVGIFDEETTLAEMLSNYYSCTYYNSYKNLLEVSDAIVIVSPVNEKYKYAKQAIKAQKHLFVRRPLCQKMAEANELVKIAEEADVKIAVGQTERFNQALLSVQNNIKNPLFIETQRSNSLQNNNSETNVVTDLMVHDIDLVLSIVKSKVKKVVANGVAVANKKIDIANARVEFENGCIANLTANRIALEVKQKMTIFQKDAYINLNFLSCSAQTVNLLKSKNVTPEAAYTIESGTKAKKKYIYSNTNNPIEINATNWNCLLRVFQKI